MNECIDNNEYKRLLMEYIDIIEKRDNFIIKRQVYLDAKHILMSYDLMKKELSLKANIKKLNIESKVIKSNVKTDTYNYLLKKEVNPLLEQIIEIDNLVNKANEYLICYENNKNHISKVSNLYKKLIVRISPTFNKMSPYKESLWQKTEIAYMYNDLNKLNIISNILDDNHKISKNYTIAEIYKNIDELNTEIDCMKNIFPFNIESNIDDHSYIDNYRNDFKERINYLIEEKNQLELSIKQLNN